MQLLIIRHADAGARDPARWPDDTRRPISSRGRKRHRKMARRLRRRDLVPTLLLSSPWLRAWETAEITAGETGGPAPVACEALADSPDLDRLAAAIGQPGPEDIVALVGHEPWAGELASLLLTGDVNRLQLDFAKSGVLGLELDSFESGSAVLSFFLRPRGD